MEDEDCGSEIIGSAFFVFIKKIQNIRNRMNGTKVVNNTVLEHIFSCMNRKQLFHEGGKESWQTKRNL
jgi:hypothetical protein